MSRPPVSVCAVKGSSRFFGKYKDPETGRWLRIPGGKFPPIVSTRELAEEFAERWYSVEIATKTLSKSVPTTWAEVCDRYSAFVQSSQKADATKHEALTRCKALRSDPILSSQPVADHDEELLLAWLAGLAIETVRTKSGKRPRKFKTLRNIVQMVRYLYRYAQSLKAYPKGWELPTSGHLFQQKMEELKRFDSDVIISCPQESVVRLLTLEPRDEQRRLLDHMGALTGARPGELHGLHVQDIKVKEGVVHLDIHQQFSLRRGKVAPRLAPLKTKHAKRLIPLHQELEEPLRKWLSFGWVVLVGRAPSDNDFIFVDESGNPYREHDSVEFQKDLELAGGATIEKGEPLTRYSLRHTFASRARSAGVDGHVRDYLLGHAPSDTKSRHYEDVDLAYLSDQANKIPGFLAEGTAVSPGGIGTAAPSKPEVWSRVWSRDASPVTSNCSEDTKEPTSQVTKKPPDFHQEAFAEAKGFEPLVGCPTPVFKTGAFDHSATLPRAEMAEMHS